MSEPLTSATPAPRAVRPINWWMLLRFVVREGFGVLVLALALFLPAGRLDWPMGWAVVAITSLWFVAMALVMVVWQPDLIAERLGLKPGTKHWDIVLLSLIGLLAISRCVVAGLDVRFGWTVAPLAPLQIIALLVAVGGYGLVVWASAVNAFFAATARIQKERGHVVVTGGPYRFVRHPGYVGMALAELALSIMLGSVWAMAPGAASAALVVVRTLLEDRMLLSELEGYQAYAGRVRYRLLPGIW